ncbi:MAG: hypothetical protein ACJAZO_005374 [Myxococcota bacterium]|jgi:hypothetical protein
MITLFLVAFAWVSPAQAEPTTLTYTLRASDAEGAPLNGETAVAVSLWTDASSTNSADRLWEETLSPAMSNGYATLLLSEDGSGNTIEDTWFAEDVWVEVLMGGALLGQRQPISTVPRAATVTSTQGQVWSAGRGDMVLNEFPTDIQATPESTDGSYSYGGYAGRAATTKRCQDLMGSGARLCRTLDLERFIAVGAINRLGESDASKLTFSADSHWISSGAAASLYGSGQAHNYADCLNFETGSSGYRGVRYAGPNSTQPSGASYTSTCNGSYPLLCCR